MLCNVARLRASQPGGLPDAGSFTAAAVRLTARQGSHVAGGRGTGRHSSALQQRSPTFSCSRQLLLRVTAVQAFACRSGSQRHSTFMDLHAGSCGANSRGSGQELPDTGEADMMPQCCDRTSGCGLRIIRWWHCSRRFAASCIRLARCRCRRSWLPCGATLGGTHHVIWRGSVKLEGLNVCC